MAAQQEWIDDVRRWCFDGSRADSPLLASTLDAVDSRALLVALPRPEFSRPLPPRARW